MATTVVLNVPKIGLTIGLGLVLESVVAVIMIIGARRVGPMPSSGKGTSASTILSLRGALGQPSSWIQSPGRPI